MKAREKSRITGPFPYESKFSSNNLVTSLVVDPLRGLGISIETQMNDMLENYRFFGGLMTSVDLRNGDFYAEFQYLKSLIDFSARVDRKGIRWKLSHLKMEHNAISIIIHSTVLKLAHHFHFRQNSLYVKTIWRVGEIG